MNFFNFSCVIFLAQNVLIPPKSCNNLEIHFISIYSIKVTFISKWKECRAFRRIEPNIEKTNNKEKNASPERSY